MSRPASTPTLKALLGKAHAPGLCGGMGIVKYHLSLPESAWLGLLLDNSWGAYFHLSLFRQAQMEQEVCWHSCASTLPPAYFRQEVCWRRIAPLPLKPNFLFQFNERVFELFLAEGGCWDNTIPLEPYWQEKGGNPCQYGSAGTVLAEPYWLSGAGTVLAWILFFSLQTKLNGIVSSLFIPRGYQGGTRQRYMNSLEVVACSWVEGALARAPSNANLSSAHLSSARSL